MWLLIINLMQVSSEKGKWGKRNTNLQFEEKRGTRKFTVGVEACATRDKEIEDRPQLLWNGGRGAPRGRPHSTKLLKWPKEFSTPKKQQEIKAAVHVIQGEGDSPQVGTCGTGFRVIKGIPIKVLWNLPEQLIRTVMSSMCYGEWG